MKRMLSVGAMLLILGAALVLVLGGCTVTVSGVGPDGYVINAKNGAPIDAASVTLTKIGSTTVYTATTGTTGHYSFSEYAQGQFELTADKTGMAFTKQVVEITGIAQTLPNIGGFTSTEDLKIIVFWDRGFADVDAHFTAQTTPPGAYPAVHTNGVDFYTSPSGYAGTGFFPDTTTGRAHLYWPSSNRTVFSPDIDLDVDNAGRTGEQPGGPETITVSYIPYDAPYRGSDPTYPSTGAGDPSKLPSGTYNWVGVGEYYLDAYNSIFTSTGGSQEASAMLSSVGGVSKTANPVVYVFFGANQLARYTLPQFTDIKTAAVLRVNMFVKEEAGVTTEWFQILPDTRVYKDEGSIKSLTGNDGIVVAGGKVRR
jgi:hypothetical protein